MGDEHTSLARGCHDLRPNLGTVKNAEKLYRVGFNAVYHDVRKTDHNKFSSSCLPAHSTLARKLNKALDSGVDGKRNASSGIRAAVCRNIIRNVKKVLDRGSRPADSHYSG